MASKKDQLKETSLNRDTQWLFFPRNTSIGLALAILFITGIGSWLFLHEKKETPKWKFATIKRGDLLVTINATGTVEPEEVIDVGAQVAGKIVSFGRDANGKVVDYGSSVRRGTVLASIDSAIYEAEEEQAQAQVKVAEANVKKTEADIIQLKARLSLAEKDWQRAESLGPSSALSQANYDAYKTAYETSLANIAVGEAALLQAKAGLSQAKAALKRAQRNLGYCTIKSPVNGIIIDRRVNIGQTVVASLNAPSLFLIAKDLKQIQVWVAVNEADIGKIHPGLPVSFTVDAFAGETFHGTVGKIRLNASMTQNVVTYLVEIITDNKSGRLLPYLTANVTFELDKKKDVLLVPNATLRWTPEHEMIAPEFRKDMGGGSFKGKTKTGTKTAKTGSLKEQEDIWITDGQYLRPVYVQTGATDGSMTEISGNDVHEGMNVITGLQQSEIQTDASNPFVPKFMSKNKKKPAEH